MIWAVLKDHQFQLGTAGASITLAAKWIFDHINPILGLLAALGGVIVVALSILQKVKQNKLIDLEIRQKERELKRNQ